MMDGMRARPEGAGVGANTPLEHPPLDDDQIDACMVGWKYGSHATPHQRIRPGCIPNPPSASR